MNATGSASFFSAASWREAYRAEVPIWLYSVKYLLALYLACWLTMRFNLGQPSTTMTTIIILMHPNSGMVLAKAFYRSLGTLVGSGFCLFLVAVFSANPDVLLFFIALWLGLCAAGSMFYRGFASYAFVLSGYTVMIVLVPVVNDPSGVFDSAVRRVSEVLLGILITTVVSDVVFPQRMMGALVKQLRGQTASLLDFLRSSLFGPLERITIEQRHLQTIREAVQVENLRAIVIFERGDVLARNGLIKQLNLDFLDLSSTFEAIQNLLLQLPLQRDPMLERTLTELYDILGAALSPSAEQENDVAVLRRRVEDCLAQWPERVARLRQSLVEAVNPQRLLHFDTVANLLQRLLREIGQYLAGVEAIRRPRVVGQTPQRQFRHHNDVLDAALAGLRTFVAMSVCGVFWLRSGWNWGSGTMLMGGVVSNLMASMPAADRVLSKMLQGLCVGVFGGFVLCFALLPLTSGFTQLVTVSLPFFALIPLISVRPAHAVFALGFGMGLISMLMPFNTTVSDSASFAADRFLDNSGSQMLGAFMAMIGFMVIPSLKTPKRQCRQLSRQVIYALEGKLKGLRDRFLSRNSDLVAQIAGSKVKAEDVRDLLGLSLDVNFLGRILIEWREHLQVADPQRPWYGDLAALPGQLSELLRRPDPARWQALVAMLDALIARLRADGADAGGVSDLLFDLCLLKSALTYERLVSISRQGQLEGASHAA